MSSSAVLHGSCTRPSSSSDLQLEIYRAAAKNDRKALAAAVQDNIERYGSDTGPDDPLQKLQGFLPIAAERSGGHGEDGQSLFWKSEES